MTTLDATPTRPKHPALSAKPSPLWSVLSWTFINSVGTGIPTTGMVFLTTSAYSFSATENYVLGVIQGLTYIAGALLAGPALRRLFAKFPRLNERLVLASLMVLLAAICVLPIAARTFSGGGRAGSWSVWVVMACYSPLTGVLWPVTESYLSGGRRGENLRSSIGTFNVVWSSALVASYWCMAPLIKNHPLEVILGVAFVHLLSVALLRPMGPRPARHIAEHHEPHPIIYTALLRVFRLQLPVSYLFYAALTPYLPSALRQLGIEITWQTLIASTWLVARVLTFFVLQRWQGWHGRWPASIVGGILLLVGFSGAVLSPGLGSGGVGLGLFVLSLVGFGIGMGTIYTGALYYAMEVGSAEVDAGGVHEALIGVGYAAGPLCGLGAYWAAAVGLISEDAREIVMIALVSALSLPVVVFALLSATRTARRGDPSGTSPPSLNGKG
ncbi:MAG: hypothetical protein KF745_02565 [Phycisphaeraceae bacterium]|nr:hypothetical protein [Phycisphaeraceae bacterium]